MGKLKKHKPTKYMLETSHYDEEQAEYVVNFIECLCHTKGKWEGQPVKLLDWQKSIIKDISIKFSNIYVNLSIVKV